MQAWAIGKHNFSSSPIKVRVQPQTTKRTKAPTQECCETGEVTRASPSLPTPCPNLGPFPHVQVDAHARCKAKLPTVAPRREERPGVRFRDSLAVGERRPVHALPKRSEWQPESASHGPGPPRRTSETRAAAVDMSSGGSGPGSGAGPPHPGQRSALIRR